MGGYYIKLYFFVVYNYVFLVRCVNALIDIAVFAKLNHDAKLPCMYQGSNYGVKVRWFSDKDGWLSEGTTVYKHTGQMFIQKPSQNEWNLNIRRISMSFEDVYTCRTADEIVLSRIKLVVETPPRITEEGSSPIRMSFSESSTVELTCAVTGKPEPEITWYRGLTEKETGISGHVLKIRDVTRYAADEYICRAENTNGEAERRMRVTVNFAPEVTIMEQEVYAAGGEMVVMSCAIAASPLYDAYWTKGSDINGRRIISDWKYIVKSDDQSDEIPIRFLTLIIKRSIVTVQDYGMYTCVAKGDGLVAHGYVGLRQRHQKIKHG